jgi:transcriptional regulator with XRE-family HTH domain
MDFVERVVGARIAERRRVVGWSQARLAEEVRLSTETISRLETGTTMPSLTRLASIARALEIELRDLFRPDERDERDERGRALEHLRALMSRRTAKEIELISALAGPILDFIRHQDQSGRDDR